MCKDCVKDPFVDREGIVLGKYFIEFGVITLFEETGSFFVNYKGCSQCGRKDLLRSVNQAKKETEFTEEIEYDHICSGCGHMVAHHNYTFAVDIKEQRQEENMECMLCGSSDSSKSVLPDDPQMARQLF